MQSPRHKNLIKLKATVENSLKNSRQKQEDKRHLVKNPLKQIEAKKREPANHNNRDDIRDIGLNIKVVRIIQRIRALMDIEDQ